VVWQVSLTRIAPTAEKPGSLRDSVSVENEKEALSLLRGRA
jgi:hypothetical protein